MDSNKVSTTKPTAEYHHRVRSRASRLSTVIPKAAKCIRPAAITDGSTATEAILAKLPMLCAYMSAKSLLLLLKMKLGYGMPVSEQISCISPQRQTTMAEARATRTALSMPPSRLNSREKRTVAPMPSVR